MKYVFAALIATRFAVAQAPAPTSQDALIQALYNEVHALRLAIEQSNRTGPMVQIAVAQMQAADDRLRSASKQLQDARDKLAESQSRRSNIEAGIKQREANLALGGDANTKHQLEEQIREFKTMIEMQASSEQELRMKEADASSAFLAEQSRWNEINEKLKSFERLLAPPQ